MKLQRSTVVFDCNNKELISFRKDFKCTITPLNPEDSNTYSIKCNIFNQNPGNIANNKTFILDYSVQLPFLLIVPTNYLSPNQLFSLDCSLFNHHMNESEHFEIPFKTFDKPSGGKSKANFKFSQSKISI